MQNSSNPQKQVFQSRGSSHCDQQEIRCACGQGIMVTGVPSTYGAIVVKCICSGEMTQLPPRLPAQFKAAQDIIS